MHSLVYIQHPYFCFIYNFNMEIFNLDGASCYEFDVVKK